MTPKPKRSELIALRVMQEQQWAYACSLEHLSYRDMRQLANCPPEYGGLGYDLSEHALKGLVRGYLDRMRTVLEADRDELIAREANDLDTLTRLGMAGLRRAAALEELDVHAAKLVLDTSKARRSLYGLDAPTETKIEVTTRDGVLDDLNAALARLGEQPVKVSRD